MTRGRKPAPQAQCPANPVGEDVPAALSAAADEMAQRSAEIAQRFDDGLPYDRNRMVNEAKYFMSQSAEAMLEAGKRLIVLKENEPHGEFMELLEERLGLNRRTAQVMMQAAVKYLSPALASKAQAPALLALGKTKLLDLIAEPDEAIEALADGGTLAGKSLDDMQAMSSRELRAALADARKKLQSKDAVIAKKDEKLNELAEAEERRRSGTPDEREQAQLDDLAEVARAADLAVRRLVTASVTVSDAPVSDAAATAARQAVEYVAQVLAGLINQHGISVDMDTMLTPEWLQPKAGAAA